MHGVHFEQDIAKIDKFLCLMENHFFFRSTNDKKVAAATEITKTKKKQSVQSAICFLAVIQR